MPKLILSDLSNLQNEQTAVSVINTNSASIEAALDNTVSRDGSTPNSMNADFDMNSNHILNLPEPFFDTEPVRKGEFDDALEDLVVGNIPDNAIDDAVSDFLLAEGTFPAYPTRTNALTNVPLDAEFFITAGTTSVGDNEQPTVYDRIATPAIVTPKEVQASNGQWYELRSQCYTPEHFGVTGTGFMSDLGDHTDGFLDCVETAFLEGKKVILQPVRYNISEKINLRNPGTAVSGPNGFGWPNIDWHGVPYHTEIYARSGMNGPLIKVNGLAENQTTAGTGVYGGGLHGIIFNGSAGAAAGLDGLLMIGWWGYKIDNCEFTRFSRHGITTNTDLTYGPYPSVVNITNITDANPAVITIDPTGIPFGAHAYAAGISVLIQGVTGTMAAALNGNTFTVGANPTATTFSINADTTGLTYTSGGTASRTDAGNPQNGDYSISQNGIYYNTLMLRNKGYGYIDFQDNGGTSSLFYGCQFNLNELGGVWARGTSQRYVNCSISYNGFVEGGPKIVGIAGMEVGATSGTPVQGLILDRIEFDSNSDTNLRIWNASHLRAHWTRHKRQTVVTGQIGPSSQFIMLGAENGSRAEDIVFQDQYWFVGGDQSPMVCANGHSSATVKNIHMPNIEFVNFTTAPTTLFSGRFTGAGLSREHNYTAALSASGGIYPPGRVLLQGRPADSFVGSETDDVTIDTTVDDIIWTQGAVSNQVFGTGTTVVIGSLTTTSGSAIVTRAAGNFASDGVKIGATVTGAGIPAGTTVTNLTAFTVLLSANATVNDAGAASLTFTNIGYNTTTGVYRTRIPGKYKINFAMRFLQVPDTDFVTGRINVGGTVYEFSQRGAGNGANVYTTVTGEEILEIAAGVDIKFSAYTTTGSYTLKGTTRPATCSIQLME